MKILVTGGAGYIGSALVERLISLGHEVKVIDDLSNGFIENINQKAEYLNGSILNDELLSRAIKGVEAVFHLAAKIRVEEGEVKPDLYRQVNVDGTLNLLKLCNSLGVKKFIFASTAAVYGDPSDYPVSEESQTKPVNVYGRTKLEIDEYLSKSAKSLSISAISFRFFNVGGAVQNSKQGWLKIKHEGATHLIPSILRSSEAVPLLIYGNDWPTSDGTAVRDFVHLSDLVDALMGSLNHLENPGHEIINLGTAKGLTVLEVVNATETILKKKIDYLFVNRRVGDSFALVTNNEKAEKLLNWKPKLSIAEILTDAYSEIQINQYNV
jgi:UDP-glucose 4-epimerase